jgi:hypothetical protein
MKLILNKKRDLSSSYLFDLKKKSLQKLLPCTVYILLSPNLSEI